MEVSLASHKGRRSECQRCKLSGGSALLIPPSPPENRNQTRLLPFEPRPRADLGLWRALSTAAFPTRSQQHRPASAALPAPGPTRLLHGLISKRRPETPRRDPGRWVHRGDVSLSLPGPTQSETLLAGEDEMINPRPASSSRGDALTCSFQNSRQQRHH